LFTLQAQAGVAPIPTTVKGLATYVRDSAPYYYYGYLYIKVT